jgi:Nitrogen regulatory protein P-II
VVESKDVGLIKEVILRHARTGSVGDGKLFVLPVEEAVRIRTGDEGELVLQAHEEEVSVDGNAPERTTAASDVLARVEEMGVEFIRLWFTDIFGQLKSFAVGREELPGALEDAWASTARRSPASTGSRSRTWWPCPTRRRSGSSPGGPGSRTRSAASSATSSSRASPTRATPASRGGGRSRERGGWVSTTTTSLPSSSSSSSSRTRRRRCSTRAATSTSPRSTWRPTSAAVMGSGPARLCGAVLDRAPQRCPIQRGTSDSAAALRA